MSRAVRGSKALRVIERACGSRRGLRGAEWRSLNVITVAQGWLPELASMAEERANLKHRRRWSRAPTGPDEPGNTPTTAGFGWWNPGDGIRRKAGERQDTPVRVRYEYSSRSPTRRICGAESVWPHRGGWDPGP